MATKAPNPIDKYVGSRVRMRRIMLGMSQEKLGEALGLTFQQIQKYERGSNRISFSRLVEIAEALSCQLSDLAEGLIAASPADELEHLNGLLAKAGALEMLEAYAALPSQDLRRAVLQHSRALVTAFAASDAKSGE